MTPSNQKPLSSKGPHRGTPPSPTPESRLPPCPRRWPLGGFARILHTHQTLGQFLRTPPASPASPSPHPSPPGTRPHLVPTHTPASPRTWLKRPSDQLLAQAQGSHPSLVTGTPGSGPSAWRGPASSRAPLPAAPPAAGLDPGPEALQGHRVPSSQPTEPPRPQRRTACSSRGWASASEPKPEGPGQAQAGAPP